MDVDDQVLKRLERIGALDRGRAGRPQLLGELQHLVREAETWARTVAAEKSGEEAEGMR